MINPPSEKRSSDEKSVRDQVGGKRTKGKSHQWNSLLTREGGRESKADGMLDKRERKKRRNEKEKS